MGLEVQGVARVGRKRGVPGGGAGGEAFPLATDEMEAVGVSLVGGVFEVGARKRTGEVVEAKLQATAFGEEIAVFGNKEITAVETPVE